MIGHKLFRAARTESWEATCQEVEDWINANVPSEDLVSVMMEDNEERWGQDVVVVWYRVRKGAKASS